MVLVFNNIQRSHGSGGGKHHQGFVDPGFRHVHRVIAGPAGAEIYSTFFLPPGSENHIVTAPGPEECT